MPIYEYCCRDCSDEFEQVVLSAAEEIRCPACASAAVEKRMSVFSSRSGRAEAGPVSGGAGCGGCGPHGCGCH